MGRIGIQFKTVIFVIWLSGADTRGQCEIGWKSVSPNQTFNRTVFSLVNWDADGQGPEAGLLVAAGGFQLSDGAGKYISAWDGVSWRSFGAGLSDFAFAVTVFNNEVIVGGAFVWADNVTVNRIARWDGSHWQPFGAGMNNYIYSLCIFGGELIAGGSFTTADGVTVNRVARWNGFTWAPLGAGMNGNVHVLYVHGGKLIAGGEFSSSGGISVWNIAYWDGTSWQPMGTGLSGGGFTPRVASLATFNGDLIAGGNFFSTSGVKISRWNGSVWQPLSSSFNDGVIGLTVFRGELIAGGYFSIAGGVAARGIARWNGQVWQPMGEGINGNGFSPNVKTFAVFQGDLWTGGAFSTAGGIASSNLARWGPLGPTPLITQQPSSPTICAGSSVSLRATATGAGVLSYRWRKDGVELVDGGEMFGTQSNTLVFVHAGVADAGSYDCVVKLNDCTQATSQAATLAVHPTDTADGNGDGVVDGRDVQLFVDSLVNHGPVSAGHCAYELNGDGIVSEADVGAFVGRLVGECGSRNVASAHRGGRSMRITAWFA